MAQNEEIQRRLTYSEKEGIANKYLMRKAETSWEDLPDVNSLHDADTEDDVIQLCIERLEESGFPADE
jgi:hypothetical protein